MAHARSSDIQRQVRTLFGGGISTGLSDAKLLERFVVQRASAAESTLAAEAAFEALVARHGPMVLGVCRRLLSDPADVEDAFQATFLVLVRRAGTVQANDSLGRWLYGVARRVAAKARAKTERRRACSAEGGGEPAEPGFDPDRAELLAALDEELGRLPCRLQTPIVLCHLEGLTHSEAASRLRWPIGTVSGRLSRARAMLRERLVRRGFTLAAGPLAALLDPEATSAAVPETLAQATCHAASRLALGIGKKSVLGASNAAALAGGVLTEIAMAQLRIAVVALAVFGVTIVGALAWAQAPGPENGSGNPGKVTARTPLPSKPGDKDQSTDKGQTTLRFPADRVMGVLYIRSADAKDWPGSDWVRLGEATGDVLIPSNRQVRLELGIGSRTDLSPLRRLHPDDLRSFRVNTLDLQGKDLEAIAHLSGLEEVQLWRCSIGDEGAQYLAKLPRLRYLQLGRCQIGDAGLISLANLSSLEHLDLGNSWITEAGLAHIGQLRSLQSLSLYACDIDDADLSHLKGLMALESLRLADCLHITDAGLAHLAGLPRLKQLDLESTQISDAGLAHLASLRSLEDLNLAGTKINDAGLAHLRGLGSLHRLSLPQFLSDAGMVHIGHLPALRNLTIRAGRVTDQGIASLAELNQLEELNLGSGVFKDFRITDAAAAHLARLPALKTLWLQHTEIGDAGLAALSKSPSLQWLNLYGNQVTPAGLRHLSQFPALSSLSLSGIKGSASSLHFLRPLKGLVHLRIDGEGWLDFNGVDRAAEADEVGSLSGMSRLESLTLNTPLSDAGMQQLASLTSLQWLEITNKNNQITDDGLAYLSGFKQLRNLLISGWFTDRGLTHLEGLKSLSRVTLNCRPGAISEEAISTLKARCPSLLRMFYTPRPKTASPPPAIGQEAPGLEVEAFDGKKIRLSDFKGKTVLLYFWATWCTPCLAETPKLKAFVEAHRGHGEAFEAISLSLDEDAHWAKRHAQRNGLDWPQAWLPRTSPALSSYAIKSAPQYVVVGPDGTIAYTGGEFDGAKAAVGRLVRRTAP